MDFSKLFLEQAKKQKRKIGIAIMRPVPETIKSLKKASKYADLVVVGAKVKGFENIVEPDQDKASEILIQLLKEKKVEGIVRGQVKDSYTLEVFFKQFQMTPIPSSHKVYVGIMQKADYSFFITTSSVYQGLTLEDKIFEVERIIRHMKEDLGVEPKIAVMGILRPSSNRGKYKLIDDITEQCTKFYEYLVSKGYDAKEYYMEYETAVWDRRNLIVPSIGFVGNSWIKSLLYLGDWRLLTTNYLDLGVVYEDGSRNEKDFFWHIIHAVALCNNQVK
ncbi:MAG: hypothetical protein WC675_01805 [Patescibacteria group bacterium]|jgi:predicted methyltransferase MtxX (methanogen marker protein 4)